MTEAAASSAPAAPADQPEINWTVLLLGFAGMVIGQFMAILDIQIVAASLPQIQAGVGASADEISWIQTAYLIPEVVMIPCRDTCRGCGARRRSSWLPVSASW
ncbi:drug resistance MFS transporter, drug:H+ antiporter-2 (14 Spanner) (DHA2) family [Brevundimonas diminuta]|uniref:Drug resistance MFS transporter, drug:H+ antiporter-2 (14 Spanner) (DHA2) family n=1 Tax=Brevundimonas diminuta TaxID=293 RepID=A0A2X1ACE4_BREDI|nr:drug resistance MFS transporter, drug:H+ antiporter-2 (14 Spanner) (DHA2) family [Brevundimonas diminuta]